MIDVDNIRLRNQKDGGKETIEALFRDRNLENKVLAKLQEYGKLEYQEKGARKVMRVSSLRIDTLLLNIYTQLDPVGFELPIELLNKIARTILYRGQYSIINNNQSIYFFTGSIPRSLLRKKSPELALGSNTIYFERGTFIF